MNKLFFFTFFLLFFLLNISLFPQENDFFLRLEEKELATFNDAITLMRLIYDEKDDNNIFIDNILWAASKKLFKVSIPIQENKINPLITRSEFAYWLSKVFNISKTTYIPNRNSAFFTFVELGIMDKGRGPRDSLSGGELLDIFSYFDYYVRAKKIKPRQKLPTLYKDGYDELPEWRKKLYRELEEQRKYEEKLKQDKKEAKKAAAKEKRKKMVEEEKSTEKVVE